MPLQTSRQKKCFGGTCHFKLQGKGKVSEEHATSNFKAKEK
jgi:hypothetical protein